MLKTLPTLALCSITALSLLSTSASAQIKVGVVASSTGPVASVGIPQKNTAALLPTTVAGLSVEYITLDDASDPTASVTAVKKLISEQKIDALIGPSGSPNAMGVIQFAAEAGVPMLAPVGTASVVLPMTEQKKWVFKTTQNDEIIADALIAHMVKNGVKTLAFIGTADPYGENWSKVVEALALKHGIKVVANEKYQRSDTSVTGQTLKIIGAKPDAVLIAAPGGPSVLPQAALVDKGYKGRFYQTHGAALQDFLKLGGKKVEGTILAASLMLVLDQVADSHPSKKVAADYVAAYEQKYGQKPATFGANVYDAGLLLAAAIPVAAGKAKPGTAEFRAALRDALESTKELVATQGVYNMTPADHCGFDERGRELITVKNGQWTLLP
ncbi:branched-chain amino acid ABC transporter substrate-binding protein [Betaproteobacteria bacterium]|nr:branched-chain amino acid ABC transporter substrate-binding protein [Betaproteobacteria bacterium]GHU06648.1 branched-chain amino acid ABC transporter substrate-binding protein [Betaproteobacteria bacterium]GHU20896.1 branched-chain amino acid ABC transporter substrate-binding protein [Betaproteobacteria bacterium]GHU22149.1 branched-chain amino acid ABC transporter substrate-binding protein [Betaproteobacteria bacterium]